MPRKKVHEDRTAYKNMFNLKAYDRIDIMVKQGKKEQIRNHAANKGLSLNAYINNLIETDMKKDSP